MKKTTKLMTVLLATAMIAQVSPMSALGDSAAGDEYTPEAQIQSGNHVHVESEDEEALEVGSSASVNSARPEVPDRPQLNVSTQPQLNASPETPVGTEDDVTLPEGTPVGVTAMQWQDHAGVNHYATLKEGTVVTSNYINVRFLLNANATTAEVTVNGAPVDMEIVGNTVVATVELINGTHQMSVTVHNGVATTVNTVSFTVDGSAAYPTLNVTPTADLQVGQTKDFLVTGLNMADISDLSLNVSLTKGLRVDDVEIPDGLTGSYIWLRGELKLNLAVSDPAAIADGVLATIRVEAPETIAPGTELSWVVNQAAFTLVDNPSIAYSEHLISSFQPAELTSVADEYFSIIGSGNPTIGQPYTMMVMNQINRPVAGASVYVNADGVVTFVGVTGENGMVTTDYFVAGGIYEIFAVDANGSTSSAQLQVKVYEYVGRADGVPYAIRFGAPVANGKTITWMSNYLTSTHEAKVRLSTSADMSDATVIAGSSELGQYGKHNMVINRYNSATLTDLVPGTVYYYQVGDGLVWSEVQAFTAQNASDTSVNIAVFGEISDSANMDLVGNAIRNGGVDYDFGILAGSLVGNAAQYTEVADKVNAIGKLPTMDMIYVANDAEKKSEVANAIFNTGAEYETYVYGNVFVAVINVTEDETTLRHNLTKMVKDAQDSHTEWQILCLRQSPYSADPAAAASLVAELVPLKAEWAGIDLVISSEDLYYARTDAIKGDEITEKNGVTYVICGSTDGKADIANTDDYSAFSNTYNSLYVSVEVEGSTMKVTAYDAKADGSVEVVDEVTKGYYKCRDDEHVYRYGVSNDYIYCAHCGTKTTVGRDFKGVLILEDYYMYYENNMFTTGWKHNGRDVYYFSPYIYMGVDGVQLIDGYVYVFENYVLVEGAWFNDNGVTKLMWAGEILTNTWHTQGGKTYYFYEDGSYATGTVEITYTNENGATVTGTYVFGADGALIEQIA